jgi:hypothetical protein
MRCATRCATDELAPKQEPTRPNPHLNRYRPSPSPRGGPSSLGSRRTRLHKRAWDGESSEPKQQTFSREGKDMAAEPGWYPDPSGGSGQIYWDGRAWQTPPTPPPGHVDPPPRPSRAADQHSLSDAERNQILDQAIAARLGGGGYVGSVDASGQVSLRRTGPVVWKRSRTWAEIWSTNPMTHWTGAAMNVMASLLTCGLFLPFWFWSSFKAPKNNGVLAVDEHGNQSWTPNGITSAQKIIRWVVFVVMLVWFSTALYVIGEINSPAPPTRPPVPPLSPNGFGN